MKDFEKTKQNWSPGSRALLSPLAWLSQLGDVQVTAGWRVLEQATGPIDTGLCMAGYVSAPWMSLVGRQTAVFPEWSPVNPAEPVALTSDCSGLVRYLSTDSLNRSAVG